MQMAGRAAYRVVWLLLALAVANLAAWSLAWLAFADRPVLLGVAMLAWVFGLRHAVDADHIAAIDNAGAQTDGCWVAGRCPSACISRWAIPPWWCWPAPELRRSPPRCSNRCCRCGILPARLACSSRIVPVADRDGQPAHPAWRLAKTSCWHAPAALPVRSWSVRQDHWRACCVPFCGR